MKAVKGKILKKLKTIKAIGYIKPERILQVNALDGHLYTSPPKPIATPRPPLAAIDEQPKQQMKNENICQDEEPEIIDVIELMKDLEEQEAELDDEINDKENVMPEIKAKNEILVEKMGSVPLSETDVSSFRRPDLESRTLFDPNLLEAFEQAVMEVKAREAERRSRIEESDLLEEIIEPPLKSRKIEEIADPITEFEEKCPPGGSESVVLYTTGLRGIRKTFEDCKRIRALLENLRIVFLERDMSMHSEFKDELWRTLGAKIVPPRLFIKGRYIGGAEEVAALHEQGRLRPLMEGIPVDCSDGPCEGCVGFRFVVCFNCNGSRRIAPPEGGDAAVDCSECNENGLIVCPFCC